MEASVDWLEKVSFKLRSASGHELIADGSADFGGENRGARPMELILMGLGGCASFDLVTILKKSRQHIVDVRCELSAKRADSIPAIFTDIHLHFIVTGHKIKAKQVEKALQLSSDKYCSATRMLVNGGVNISHDFEIIEVDSDAES